MQIQPSYSNLSCGSFTWTESPGASENLPVGCANWWEAAAFCIWDGGFLPSEAEFAYAAAGGSEQREYPWGSADPGTANQYAVYGCFFPNVGGCSDAPVGTAAKGVGRWGQADLAGEIMQRTLDAYGAYADYAEPCNDCSILMPQGSPQLGAVRGSAPQNPAPDLISTWRVEVAQSTRNGVVGFRCARTP